MLLAGAAVALMAGACGPGYVAPAVTPQLAKISRSPQTLLERGHSIHQAKCAKCHSFENPANYEVAELSDEIMPKMARKSKLDAADERAVLVYLLASRQLPADAAKSVP